MNKPERRKSAVSSRLILLLVFVLVILIGVFWWQKWDKSGEPGSVGELLVPDVKINPQSNADEFARAEGPQDLVFPADFGAHPDYQTEWWYYTGNLDDPTGNHFGYQLTFFRRALVPPDERPERSSAWAADQAYMAHFALTDVSNQSHDYFERLSRGAAGLAGAQGENYRVWLEDWFVEEIAANTYRLYASDENIRIELTLKDIKGPILHGEAGYSQKGPDPGNASYYYSQTHLETNGTISIGESVYPVKGMSWKDHEYSTSALSEGQIGWDWFSMQLNDNYELMVFQIRRADGSIDNFSSGTLIMPDGATRHLTKDDFQIEVLDFWESPETGAIYPSKWKVQIPSEDLTIDVIPFTADQELKLTYNYWEGAVQINGNHAGKPVRGSGYVEMTGYAGSMSGEF